MNIIYTEMNTYSVLILMRSIYKKLSAFQSCQYFGFWYMYIITRNSIPNMKKYQQKEVERNQFDLFVLKQPDNLQRESLKKAEGQRS